jgi:hypothetical protein
MSVFFHSGDLGDIIASLPAIRQLGGGELIIGQRMWRPLVGNRESMKGARFQAIEPLLKSIPYLSKVTYQDHPAKVDYDFSQFRPMTARFLAASRLERIVGNKIKQTNLVELQARYLGLKNVDILPWIKVNSEPASNGKIVVARSARNHNPRFPWQRLVEARRRQMVFIGLPTEHREFEREFGELEYKPTPDLLQVARLIAGSDLFIGNQGCPAWIAMAMGCKLIQETNDNEFSSVMERPNACFDMDKDKIEHLLK